jgi:hypothetical protein
VFFRARIFDALGNFRSRFGFPVHSWLSSISPRSVTGVQLFADQPILDSSGNELIKFVKTSSAVNEITITNTANGQIKQFTANDTSFVPLTPLEACTSYRWSVHANMVNGPASDQITANSPGTFVIQTAECPTATLLYQNFPNPFGGGLHRTRASGSIWPSRERVAQPLRLARAPRAHDRPRPAAGAARLRSYGRQSGTEGMQQQPPVGRARRRRAQRPPGVYIAVFTPTGFARPSRSCIEVPDVRFTALGTGTISLSAGAAVRAICSRRATSAFSSTAAAASRAGWPSSARHGRRSRTSPSRIFTSTITATCRR